MKKLFRNLSIWAPYSKVVPQAMSDYLSYVRDQYYIEGGMQVYRLKEVVVSGKQEKQKDVYRSMADVTIDRENMPTYAWGIPFSIMYGL